MKYELAIEDPDTPFSHVAFTWEPDYNIWQFLCAGRTLDELEHRVAYWISRGISSEHIRKYVCAIPPATPVQAELQAIEGESWGAWVGRLRAAQRPVSPATVAEQGGNPTPTPLEQLTPQPQLISEELWAAIIRQRPKAYSVLMGYNIRTVIVTSGTSRTKLEFPDCPDGIPGTGRWVDFDRDNMNPHRPIIVLEGIPENGFKPMPGLRGLLGTK